jgi:hypothetical protein
MLIILIIVFIAISIHLLLILDVTIISIMEHTRWDILPRVFLKEIQVYSIPRYFLFLVFESR